MAEHKVARFSSCRGVAFEINPEKTSPFSIATTPIVEAPKEPSNATWVWLPWTQKSSFKVFPTSLTGSFHRSLSRPSNHFCDLDVDDEDDHDDDTIYEDEEEVDLEVFFEKDLEKQNSVLKTSFGSKPSTKRQESLLRKLPPKKPQSRLSIILLDQGLFTVYKRLFVVCFTLNIIGIVLAAVGRFPYAKEKAALFSIANILALVLCRSEAILRVVFMLAVKVLGRSWISVQIRTATTSFLQCLGGVHSGCGVSAIAWLIFALILTLNDRNSTSSEIIAVASSLLFLIGLSLLVWVFIVLTNSYEPYQKTNDFSSSRFIKTQEFWITLVITIVIILPWLTVRRVPVRISTPSNHASIIKFEGGIKAGILGRISPSPFSEWHAFGIISDGKNEHMMLAGAVGDFTKTLVSNPPSHLWVRGVHFAGLPYLVNMYERVVLVATGSGICVFLSFLLQPSRADVCVIWVAKGIEQNFGKEIQQMMSGFPKDKVIVHDTAVLGRPNVAKLSIDAAKKWDAQVVIVTSNPEGSRDVVDACKGAGIPAFGPIRDS
ncbi:adenylate-forming reductase 06235-like [Papaver somniferum]|uniref:adenylate-forming reductase 06235-like n=1 Tax=Papaver somniferum TaxID=3469 RepID=UPI000E6FB9EA|nr:adenylate-forming reductase 06235-like [Papaver somniferum]